MEGEDFACGDSSRKWDLHVPTKDKTAKNTHKQKNRLTVYTQTMYSKKMQILFTYSDETWVNAHHCNKNIWVDSDRAGGWIVPSGREQGLIILHAGGMDGWIDRYDSWRHVASSFHQLNYNWAKVGGVYNWAITYVTVSA